MAGVAPGVEEANILVVVGMNESPTGAGHRGNRTSRTVRISVFMKLPSVHISLSWPVGGGPQPPLPRRILASVIAASSPPVGLAPPDEGRFGPPCILASRVEGGASGPVPHLPRASLLEETDGEGVLSAPSPAGPSILAYVLLYNNVLQTATKHG